MEPTDRQGGIAVVNQVADLIRRAATEASPRLKLPRVAVIGVPGAPDPATGHIRMAPNIPGIGDIDAPGLWREILGIEVFIENDVNLAALGEHWLTKRGDKDDLIYVSIGTGIGAGIVIGGQLHRGMNGAAGEIGYLPSALIRSNRKAWKSVPWNVSPPPTPSPISIKARPARRWTCRTSSTPQTPATLPPMKHWKKSPARSPASWQRWQRSWTVLHRHRRFHRHAG